MYVECGKAILGELLGAGDRAREGLPAEVALGGPRQMVIPHAGKGVIEADAFKTVVEADRPAMLPREVREDVLGQIFEARYRFELHAGPHRTRRYGPGA